MSDRPWWQTGVIYQIAVPSFADSNRDGLGDLRGIIERLDHLAGADSSLGIDAIWLSPINVTPFGDFGYDVADYRDIDPRFGTMADLEDLLSACHARGVRVVMDLVLNHTSAEHPWFRESRSSRDDPRRDWYVWRDGRASGKPPNRWLAVVEGSAWEFDETTGQYYYHAFLPFQPDLDWRNPEVRDEMLDVARFWLRKGVDGFRLDLVNCLVEDAALRDNPRRLGTRPYFCQHHLHDLSQPESLEAARELRSVADEFPGRALMGEVFTNDPADAIAYLGDGSDRLHLSFYLDFARRAWNAREFCESVRWLEEHVPPDAWPCYYLDNHDLVRSYTRLGGRAHADARARVAAAMQLTVRGTPIVYYGQELGMRQSGIPRRLMRDPVGRRFWPLAVGRDGARTPMQWDAGPNAGFSVAEPWLPVDRSHARRNVAAESADPDSLLNWYRRLLALRRERQALREGSFRALDDTPRTVFGYVRQHGDERVIVVLNFSARPATLTLPPDPGSWHPLLSTHPRTGTCGPEITLAPHEALILDAR